jgi:hypothetical protein
MKYFHINYVARTNWFAEILKRFHNTEHSDWPSEYALGLNTKFEIVEPLRLDINGIVAELDQDFRKNQGNIDKCIAERGEVARAYALNQDLAFRTVAALECFITAGIATWDIALAFTVRLCRNLNRQMDGRTVERELKASGVNLSWLDLHEKLRNFHLHEGSIWIAVEVSSDDPRSYRLIILRRNTKDLSNAEDWIAWDELEKLYQGLREGLMGLQGWLLKQIP